MAMMVDVARGAARRSMRRPRSFPAEAMADQLMLGPLAA